jgi:hypothetical protein
MQKKIGRKKNNMSERLKLEKILHPKEFLDEGKKRELSRDALVVARQAFGSEMGEEDVYNHVIEFPHILYLARNDEKLVGFSSYREFNLQHIGNVLYLDGIAVKPEFQREGLFKEINCRQISDGEYRYFAMRTQSQVIYGATKSLKAFLKPNWQMEVYPNRELKPTKEVRDLAIHLAKNELGMGDFDPETFVGRKTYGKSLYGQNPHYPGAADFFEDVLNLDSDKGDSVIIIGSLKKIGAEGW